MIVTRKLVCELITETLNTGIDLDGEKLEAVILGVNSDLQVRDWLMGAPVKWGIEDSLEFIEYMCRKAPSEDLAPFITIQAVFRYELGQDEAAAQLLKYANTTYPDYALANLLTRVMDQGWPRDSFRVMREEVHPKIVEECFSDEAAILTYETGALNA